MKGTERYRTGMRGTGRAGANDPGAVYECVCVWFEELNVEFFHIDSRSEA